MGCECQKGEEKVTELKSDERNPNYNERDEINAYLSQKKMANNDNIVNMPNYNNKLQPIDPKAKPKDDFSRYVFALINSLRLNPPSYIDTILRAKNNVTTDKSGIKIYKSSVKVALNKGILAFDEAIEDLRNTLPMKRLKFNPDFVVDTPKNELDVKSKVYLTNQIRLKLDEGIDIKSFWKDIVKDSETCFILTVVDDSGKTTGNKRSDILNKDNKYIGISSVRIGKSFACYIVIG